MRRTFPAHTIGCFVLLVADIRFLQPKGGCLVQAIFNSTPFSTSQTLDQLPSQNNGGNYNAFGPTDAPSANPTESPAPSPSPSESPTGDPDKVTVSPSGNPTESPAPSPSPSDTPTIAPTTSPSESPSTSPSSSAQPSGRPTTTVAPSTTPSISPSSLPSAVPSAGPTMLPSTVPSSFPTYSPTIESVKTKTAETNVFLEDIDREMDEMTLARFEVATLEFIRQAKPMTSGYDIDILAVTVLTQNVVFPEGSILSGGTNGTNSTHQSGQATSDEGVSGGENTGDRRFLQSNSSTWDVALQVRFRTVGVVTSGRVPQDFKLEELSDYGFETNFNQYLWQLGNSNEFFYPLRAVSNGGTEMQENVNEENQGGNSKAQFVIAILFSLLAFGLAIVASWFAVRRHLGKQKKGSRRRSNKYEGDFPDHNNLHPTESSSDDERDDTDAYRVDASGILRFGVSVNSKAGLQQDDEKSLESVGLTPRATDSPAHRGFRDEDDDELPLSSPDAMESRRQGCGTVDNTACGTHFGLGGQPSQIFKKWMTPRQSTGQNSNISRFSNASTTGRFDPPDKSGRMGAKPPSEPVAVKASTSDKAGTIVDEAPLNRFPGDDNADDGHYTLPISFFSKGTEYQSDLDAGTPMSSLAGSTASSSFLFNIGKSFAGRNSSTGGRLSEPGGSIKLEEVATNNSIQENYTFSGARTGGPDKNSEAGSTAIDNKRYISSSRMSDPRLPKVPKKPGSALSNKPESNMTYNATAYSTSPNNPKMVQQAVAQIQRKQQNRQAELRSIPKDDQASFLRGRKGSNEGVGDTLEAVEVTIGARSMEQEEDSPKNDSSVSTNKNYEPRQEHRQPAPTSSTGGPRNKPAYGYPSGHQRMNKPVRVTAIETNQTPGFNLGARPMTESVECQHADDKTTLSTAVNRPGTYDVYAPNGPIGIVVDTSKDGPCVHSLKSTSPMLGLINPGDLIVALDDEDTRGMTAAALTRLMAKKSRERERKITLYSMDGF